MHEAPDTVEAAAEFAGLPEPDDTRWGWYLYGITKEQEAARGSTSAEAASAERLPSEGEPAEHISTAGLVALVRRVSLAEFSPEALRGQAENPSWLESMARRHHAVVEAVHATRAVLPARFGSVYAGAEDVRAALDQERDALRARLSWIEGCDEWGVRLYGELAAIQRRAEDEQEDVRRARDELASASPGRAYLLRRKLAEQSASAFERFLDEVTGRAYKCFVANAQAGQVTWRLSTAQIGEGEQQSELMRAAFLVPRAAADAFLEDVRQFAEGEDGLRCEYSGPWPPYSFAAQIEEIYDG